MKNSMTDPFALAELDARLRHAPSLLLIEGRKLARLVLERAAVPVRHVSRLEEAELVLAGFTLEVLLGVLR